MPRKGPAPRRELVADPIYNSVVVTQLTNKVMLHGKRSIAEKIVYDAMKQDRCQDRRRAARHGQACCRQRQAAARGAQSPRRRCHISGSGRGPPSPFDDAGDPLAGRLQPGPTREVDGRMPRQRADGRRQRSRRVEEARRHPEDGRIQQGVRPLPLVTRRSQFVERPARNGGAFALAGDLDGGIVRSNRQPIDASSIGSLPGHAAAPSDSRGLKWYFEHNDGRLIHKWDSLLRHLRAPLRPLSGRCSASSRDRRIAWGSLQRRRRQYFGRRSVIVGIDIDERTASLAEPGIHVHVGDRSVRH